MTSHPQDNRSVLIVGAGVFGASTAFHLSKTYADPSAITVIDRTPPSPEPAASTDINKIIRADYASPFYCELAYEALDAWAHWPELQAYYHQSGWVALDAGDSDLASRIRATFQARGHDPTEDVPFAAFQSRWNGVLRELVTDGFRDAYANPEAGWCDATAATKSMMTAAMDRGVKYEIGEVDRFELSADGVRAVTLSDGRTLSADLIVLATGAWTSHLLSPVEDALDIPEADRVEQQAQAAGVSVAHFELTDDEMAELADMPVVVYGEHGEALPPPRDSRLLKFNNAHTFSRLVTTPSGRRISVPLAGDQRIVPESLQREMDRVIVSKVMPRFTHGRKAAFYRLCWDAYTPTQDWLLCRHPHDALQNMYLAVGGSFHSYKFLPIIGKYMCNVLTGVGNGLEKDQAWQWKGDVSGKRGAHENTRPHRDFSDLE